MIAVDAPIIANAKNIMYAVKRLAIILAAIAMKLWFQRSVLIIGFLRVIGYPKPLMYATVVHI